MSAIKVFKEKDPHGEWVFWCEEHLVETVTPDWDLAYEAAAGHAAMQHPRVPNLRDLIYQIVQINPEAYARLCGCDVPLP